jgi:hypothetical protein
MYFTDTDCNDPGQNIFYFGTINTTWKLSNRCDLQKNTAPFLQMFVSL